MLLTVYARREPASLRRHQMHSWIPGFLFPRRAHDVAIYRDKAATQPWAVFAWHQSQRPRTGARTVTLNCWRWTLEWLSALPDPRADIAPGRLPRVAA